MPAFAGMKNNELMRHHTNRLLRNSLLVSATDGRTKNRMRKHLIFAELVRACTGRAQVEKVQEALSQQPAKSFNSVALNGASCLFAFKQRPCRRTEASSV